MRTRTKLAALVILGVLFFSQASPAQACFGLFCHGRCGGVMYYGGGMAPGPAGGSGFGYWTGGGTPYGYWTGGGTPYGYWTGGGTPYGYWTGGTGYGWGAGTGYGYQGVNPAGLGQGFGFGGLLQDVQQAASILSKISGGIAGLGGGPGGFAPSGQLPGTGVPPTSASQAIRIDLYVHQDGPAPTTTATTTPTTTPTLESRVNTLENDVKAALKILTDAKAAGKL
jgi:hypothetical protein